MCSDAGRVGLIPTCRGWTPNEPLASIVRSICGGAFSQKASTSSARVVREWATRRRRSEKANTESLQRRFDADDRRLTT